jgi:predicted ThiF/HesA family dinucleotide-utilizing enzyme
VTSGAAVQPSGDMLLADVKVIGLGGVGAVVAQAMAQFLASRGGRRALWLIDGDRYEGGNRDRVLFEAYENKAIAKARELSRATGGHVAVRPVPEYATPQNVARLVVDGDIVFACVDNHASRRLIGNRCRRLRDAVLISGGNDGIEAGQTGTCGNAQIFVRAAGLDRTNHVARYHPEVARPADRRPDQLGCDALTPSAPQLLFTNLAVGAAMLGLYHAWLTGTLDHEEVYLDIAGGRMVPVRRAAPRQTASRRARRR